MINYLIALLYSLATVITHSSRLLLVEPEVLGVAVLEVLGLAVPKALGLLLTVLPACHPSVHNHLSLSCLAELLLDLHVKGESNIILWYIQQNNKEPNTYVYIKLSAKGEHTKPSNSSSFLCLNINCLVIY